MITLITGSPGTGKTAALVSLLSQLASNRAVFVNGIPDLQVSHQELEDVQRWMDLVPDGSAIAVDEAQRIWRPMGPGQRVPDHIAALETHRHRGIDFFVITQSPKLIHANVRALVGRHIHLRDTGILGRWWYEWPECCDACVSGWKGAPIRKKYKLPKKAFALYTSATEHIKASRSVPRTLIAFGVAVCALGFIGSSVYQRINAKIAPPVRAPSPVQTKAGLVTQAQPVAPAAPGAPGAFIDDRVAWIPRISYKPESAPAYDAVRQVVAMPVVAAAVCRVSECRCYTQQGTPAGLTSEECRAWLENPPFNAYQQPVVSPQPVMSGTGGDKAVPLKGDA